MIEQLLDLTNYATDSRVARRKGSGGSQEFFTPYSIVKRMCDNENLKYIDDKKQ